jgi:Na+-translocating ferredoxin:NAD+ oxidoreductase subunit E
MMAPTTEQLIERGLWSNNVGLVQLLGLCPLLAVSGSAVHALGLGLATVLALASTAAVIAALRRWIPGEIRLPSFLLLIAGIVTAIELLMHAFLPALHAVLGLFLPLIVTNCALLGRAEAFASRNDPLPATVDGAAMGLGFLGVLLALGLLRELIGQGSVFAGAGALLHLPWLERHVHDHGLLLAALPPGAFLLLAALIAAKQWRDARRPITTPTSREPDERQPA